MSADRDRLAGAIRQARFICLECGSANVTLDYADALGWIPVVHHFRLDDNSWCPATHGGVAEFRASLDLLHSLASQMPISDYGAPCWHRRARVTA